MKGCGSAISDIDHQKGTVIQALVHVTAQYGYEVKLEVVGETGELSYRITDSSQSFAPKQLSKPLWKQVG